jgi:ABC-2 type transport system permease protein
MNTPSNAAYESSAGSSPGSQGITPARIPATAPMYWSMYWSVRRELWESRSIYIAPLAVAGLIVLGFLIGTFRLGPQLAFLMQQQNNFAALLIMLTTFLVAVFYCLDALHGERRDRSILFWKSMPVSDLTTVLAKASIPLVVLPLLVFAIIVAVQWIMLLVSAAVLFVSGQSVAEFWTKLPFFRMTLLMFYHLVTAHALWPFPVYCWLLLVSGWARRATFLWAALPLLAIAGVEQIVFHTSHFAHLVGSRLIGDTETAGNMFPTGPMTHITPGLFLTSPGLWIGFAAAAAFLAAAVRLRRYQGPI